MFLARLPAPRFDTADKSGILEGKNFAQSQARPTGEPNVGRNGLDSDTSLAARTSGTCTFDSPPASTYNVASNGKEMKASAGDEKLTPRLGVRSPIEVGPGKRSVLRSTNETLHLID